VQPAPDDKQLTARERAAVIHRIRSLVEFWGITPEELEGDLPPPLPVEVEMPAPAVIKYRHPQSGATWDGVGPHPQWLRDALLKEGFTVEQLKPAATDL
jgi:DNA-binding protein H-NS